MTWKLYSKGAVVEYYHTQGFFKKRPATATGSRNEILGITRRVSIDHQMGATPAVPKDGNRIFEKIHCLMSLTSWRKFVDRFFQ
jgi:hypothetical protein